MKKQYIIISVIIFAVLAAILLLRASESPEVLTVTSDDGAASLIVPEGSLPKDVSPGDLKLEKLSDTELADMFISDLAVGYRLLPDGLVLSAPARMINTIPITDAGNVVLAFHYSESSNSLEHTPVQAVIDLQSKETTVTTEVNHFSARYFGYGGVTAGLNVRPYPLQLGDRFNASAGVHVANDYSFMSDEGAVAAHHVFDPEWGIEGWFEVRPDSREIISPDLIAQRPPFTGGITSEDYSTTGDFGCIGEGLATLHYHFILQRTKDVEYLADSVVGVFESWITSDLKNVKVQDEYDMTESVNCRKPFGQILDDIFERDNSTRSEDSSTNDSGAVSLDRVTRVWLKFGNAYFPEEQFAIANLTHPEEGHECLNDNGALALHYHAKEGNSVHGTRSLSKLEPTTLVDYAADGCGFGFYDDIERVNTGGPIITQ